MEFSKILLVSPDGCSMELENEGLAESCSPQSVNLLRLR